MAVSTIQLTYPGCDYIAGRAPVGVTLFAPGVPEYADDVRARARADGVIFGQAFVGAVTHRIGFALWGEGGTSREREQAVRPLVAEFLAAWGAESLRHTPGGLAELRVGDRACFGQPRITGSDYSALWDGQVQFEVEFIASSPDWVTAVDTESGEGQEPIHVVIPLSQPATNGLRFPSVPMFTFQSDGNGRSGWVENPGVKPAWPRFEIRPDGARVVDPMIMLHGVGSLLLSGVIESDQVAVVETAPERRGVFLNGTPSPGMISPHGLRLSEMRLPSGSHEFSYAAVDQSQLSTLHVSVRPVVDF